jgi:hypothetical protein
MTTMTDLQTEEQEATIPSAPPAPTVSAQDLNMALNMLLVVAREENLADVHKNRAKSAATNILKLVAYMQAEEIKGL